MTASATHTSYSDGYNNGGIGGMLAAVLFPADGSAARNGFGKFCLVIAALSIIANNCPNIYSVAFSLQVLSRWTAAVPRFVWTFLATIVYCAIAIPGYSHFEDVLENFMLLIAYWLAIYEAISLSDHFLFKRGFSGYNVASYDQPSKLPPGFAAIGAFCFGVFGAVMGLAQVWFVGPIAIHIGNTGFGGDIGFELAFCFAAITYVLFRTVELRYFKR